MNLNLNNNDEYHNYGDYNFDDEDNVRAPDPIRFERLLGGNDSDSDYSNEPRIYPIDADNNQPEEPVRGGRGRRRREARGRNNRRQNNDDLEAIRATMRENDARMDIEQNIQRRYEEEMNARNYAPPYNRDDDELMRAINLSREEYANSIQNTEREINDSLLDNDILIAMQISQKEQEEAEKIMSELIASESIALEKEKRIESLKTFNKRIRGAFLPSQRAVKEYVENALNDYFELKCDFVAMEDEEMYNQLYQIVDSYYRIPLSKKMGRFAISEEEDTIVRNLFRKA